MIKTLLLAGASASAFSATPIPATTPMAGHRTGGVAARLVNIPQLPVRAW